MKQPDEAFIQPRPRPRYISGWTVTVALAVITSFALIRRAGLEGDAGRLGNEPVSSERQPILTAPFKTSPPARGWMQIPLRLMHNVSEHRVMALAAGMTFYSLLAIFPALAALVAIYSLFADPATISAHLNSLSGFLPAGAIDITHDQLSRIASKGRQSLGSTFLIGLAFSVWSANAAMKSMFDTLNVIYGARETRGIVKLNLISLCFTFGGIAFAVVALGTVVILPVVLQLLGLPETTDLLLRVSRWPALFIVLTGTLAVLCRYGPDRDPGPRSWITWGSALAALLWIVVSATFSWYAANFGSYNETYGSLGAVVGFMTWLWISAVAVLIGAEFDAEMNLPARSVGLQRE